MGNKAKDEAMEYVDEKLQENKEHTWLLFVKKKGCEI